MGEGRNNGGGIVHFKSPEGDRVEEGGRQAGRQADKAFVLKAFSDRSFPIGALGRSPAGLAFFKYDGEGGNQRTNERHVDVELLQFPSQ